MKKILFAIVIAAMFAGCEMPQQCNCQSVLEGSHELRLIRKDSASTDGAYTVVTDNTVRYMWKMNDSAFVMSTLPIDKVRVKIDETVDVPYIKYRWVPCAPASDVQYVMNEKVIYAVLTCASKDCPPEFNMVEEVPTEIAE